MDLPGLEPRWEEALLTLYFETVDGDIRALGNAVVIAANGQRGIALTAAHNVEGLNRLAVRRANPNERGPFPDLATARSANPNYPSFVVETLGERHCAGERDIVTLGTFTKPDAPEFDLAVATVNVRPDAKHPLEAFFALKLLPPEPGETVRVVGTHSVQPVETLEEDGQHWLGFAGIAVSRPVKVIGSDEQSVRLSRGPTFEVDMDFDPGLSGAPVICNRDGVPYVCGVVSSGADQSGRGSAAVIWPLLQLSVPVSPGERVDVLELVRRGVIRTYGDEAELFPPLTG